MSLTDLQRVIETTRAASASALTRDEAGAVRTATQNADAIWTRDLINRCWGVTIATVRDDGTPHAAVTFAVCIEGTIYLSASRGTALLHNLRARPEVALTCLGNAYDSIMAAGRIGLVGAWADLNASLREAMNAVRAPEPFMPDDWPGYVFRFEPQKLWTIAGS